MYKLIFLQFLFKRGNITSELNTIKIFSTHGVNIGQYAKSRFLFNGSQVLATKLLFRISFQSAMNREVSLYTFNKDLVCALINIGRFETDSTDGLWSQLPFWASDALS